MKFCQNKYYTCYSPRIKKSLSNLGYFPQEEFENVKTKKICFVYKRDCKLNLYLGMAKYNFQNNLGYKECQIIKLINNGDLFPETCLSDYDIRPIEDINREPHKL